MSENNTPEPPDSAYPEPTNPYAAPPSGNAPNNPYAPPPPPPAPMNPGVGGQQYGGPYSAPGQPGSWPPPPVGSYNNIGQPYSPVNATMILILGILGLTICGICAPIAWVMGNQALATLDQFGDPLAQRGMVNGGRICGIVGSVLISLIILFYILAYVGLFAVGFFSALHPSS